MNILRIFSQAPILLVLIKKTVYQACILHYGKIVAYILAYVLMVFTYHLKRLWLLLRPLFAIGKH